MPTPEELAAQEAERLAAEAAAQNQEKSPEELAAAQAQQEAERLAAEQAAQQIVVTDEIFEAELAKRYGERGIKSKTELEAKLAEDYSGHLKPKSELIKKLNEWDGDPETFLRLNKLDVDAMDNKAAIIENMKIKEGMTDRVAEIAFNKRYGHALKTQDDPDFDEEEHEMATFNLQRDGVTAKSALSQWKVSEMEKGQQKIDVQADADREKAYEERYLKPLKTTIDNLQKLDFNVKYSLPDKTEVEENFVFAITNADSKKIAEDMLAVKDTAQFMEKYIKRYGLNSDKTANLTGLTEPILFYENRHEYTRQVMEIAASKAIERHLANLKPGDLGNERRAGDQSDTKTVDAATNIVNAMNKAASQK